MRVHPLGRPPPASPPTEHLRSVRLKRSRRYAALAALCALTACTVGPDFRPPVPATPAPSTFGAEPADVKSTTFAGAVDLTWWTSFKDPELTSLVGRLARQNLDLQIAAERVEQARSQRRIAQSQGLPQVDAHAQYTHTRESPAGTLALLTPAPGAPLEYNLWQDSVSASWEIDLFGRVRRSVEAARADTEAEVEARRSLALAAIADLATDYLQLRDLQTREGIARRNLQLATENLALVRNRFDNGVATTLDTAQAAGQRATIASSLPELLSEEARLINAIGLLLAEPPRGLQAELAAPKPEPGGPPRVPVGLPGDLVRRRPDVREAEARLHSATAQTGVAVADFYPDITLMGDEGLQGLRFADAFSPRDRQFDIGPSISLPIFHGGRLRARLQLRRSEQRAAAVSFQKTVLQAWRDVDDALTAYAQAQRRQAQVDEALRQDRIALAAARQRYAEGAADFLNVLSAQTALLNQQNAQAETNANISARLVDLYKALGGGWEPFT